MTKAEAMKCDIEREQRIFELQCQNYDFERGSIKE